jgi:hypothetical protein
MRRSVDDNHKEEEEQQMMMMMMMTAKGRYIEYKGLAFSNAIHEH